MNTNIIDFHITSSRPLMLQADTLANPLHPQTIAHKKTAGKRKKSEDDHLWLLQHEWECGLYIDPKLGPYIPGNNIEACIAEAAKVTKQGKLVKQALAVNTDRAPIEYDGPRDIKGLYGDGNSPFVDIRGVNVSNRKVMRARPIFLRWACSFQVSFMEDMISPQDAINIVSTAGRLVGLGTYRPKFGRFEIERTA